jgi:GTPase Era involved in 16S rRNA processing
LIIKGENGLINMFVMPEDLTESLQETFNSATMFGTSFLLESAKIIIVGEDGEEVKNVKESAQQTLRFSA